MSQPSAFGTFRVLHQIGSGVLGPVFRAHDAQHERLVAIKAFKLDLVPEAAERVAEALREFSALDELHPAIVRALDAGLADNTPYLALEYVTGDGLDLALRQFGAPTMSDVLALCESLAAAVDAAWTAGVGHGALHPRDIFVLSGSGEISITGFGIAQALESAGIKPPVRRPYASPERVAGAAWDRRADIYAIAAITREVFAAGGQDFETAALDRVWQTALAEMPENRFETAAEFAAAVRDAVGEGARVIAAPAPAPAIVELQPADDTDEMEELDVRIEPAVVPFAEIEPAVASPVPIPAVESARTFPWAATIAVAIAGLAVGSVGGYAIGRSRGARQATAPATAQKASLAETVVASPIAPPPAATAPVVPEQSVPPVPQTNSPAVPALTGGKPVAPAPARRSVASHALASSGSLNVDSRPRGARVTIDGRAHGQTPVRIPGLSPGDHRVLIELTGHRRVSSTVKVVGGEQTRFAVTLEETGAVLKKR